MVKLFQTIKKIYKRLTYKSYLRRLDSDYYCSGATCWSLFPPSFYLTHTPEEVEKAKRETLDELKKMLENWEKTEYGRQQENIS